MDLFRSVYTFIMDANWAKEPEGNEFGFFCYICKKEVQAQVRFMQPYSTVSLNEFRDSYSQVSILMICRAVQWVGQPLSWMIDECLLWLYGNSPWNEFLLSIFTIYYISREPQEEDSCVHLEQRQQIPPFFHSGWGSFIICTFELFTPFH